MLVASLQILLFVVVPACFPHVCAVEISYINLPKTFKCDLPTDSSVGCLVSRGKIEKFSQESYLEYLISEDSKTSVRRISTTIQAMSPKDVPPIRDCVDIFLTTRPWWILMKEHFFPARQEVKYNVEKLFASAEGDGVVEVILMRQAEWLQPYLKFLSVVQFPPPEICRQSRLGVGHLVDSGWGAQLGMYGSFYKRHPWIIFNIWDSISNLPSDGVFYSSSSTCPDVVNKRLCAFLALTNCTMPKALTSKSKNEFHSLWPRPLIIYSSTSESGLPIPDLNTTRNQLPENDYQRYHHSIYFPTSDRTAPMHFELAKFMDGDDHQLNAKMAGSRNSPLILDTVMSYGFIFRPNGRYRALIYDRIERFRQEYLLSRSQPQCVAIHIRRGDRTLEGVDIINYCKNYTRYSGEGGVYCTHRYTGKSRGCLGLDNYGCFSAHPFGSLSLQDYLDRAWQLIPTRNVFVMTDDGEWLDDQRRTVSPEWNVMALSGKREPRTSSKATQGGVDFMASVALARQCRGFVGHWSSSVAVLVFRSMCMQHWRYVGRCPLGFNIGGGSTLSVDVKA